MPDDHGGLSATCRETSTGRGDSATARAETAATALDTSDRARSEPPMHGTGGHHWPIPAACPSRCPKCGIAAGHPPICARDLRLTRSVCNVCPVSRKRQAGSTENLSTGCLPGSGVGRVIRKLRTLVARGSEVWSCVLAPSESWQEQQGRDRGRFHQLVAPASAACGWGTLRFGPRWSDPRCGAGPGGAIPHQST